jgi:hypothetical protein
MDFKQCNQAIDKMHSLVQKKLYMYNKIHSKEFSEINAQMFKELNKLESYYLENGDIHQLRQVKKIMICLLDEEQITNNIKNNEK